MKLICEERFHESASFRFIEMQPNIVMSKALCLLNKRVNYRREFRFDFFQFKKIKKRKNILLLLTVYVVQDRGRHNKHTDRPIGYRQTHNKTIGDSSQSSCCY